MEVVTDIENKGTNFLLPSFFFLDYQAEAEKDTYIPAPTKDQYFKF
jgi:hypothetical protein